MADGDSRKNPRIRGVTGPRQVTSIVVNSPQGPQRYSDPATWAIKDNQDLIPRSKIPPIVPTTGSIDNDAVNKLIRDGVYPWGLQGNSDPIPRDKLTNAVGSGETSLLLASKEATLGLPTLAETTLTANSVNTYTYQEIGGFSGNGVALFIVPSVVSGVGRITFPKEGFISGTLAAHIDIMSSTSGQSGSSGNLSFIINLYNSDGTLKDRWFHSKSIQDPITRSEIDHVNISINMTPINANSYMTMNVAFESSVANRNARISIPAASTNRREQLDIFYYTKEQVANWAVENNNDKIPVEKLPTAATEGLNQSEVDDRIIPFARAGNTDTIPRDKLPGGGGVASWAEPDSTEDIPPSKLKDILSPTNQINVLRDVSTQGTVSSLVLPTDYATAFRYLLVGGHPNSEFGILDTKYLAANATLRSETYTWTRATRTLSGLIKGAYLYGIDKKLSFEEDGWLRARETTIAPVVPTTSANDGQGEIIVSEDNVNKYPFFAFRVFEPGTLQFLPSIFYKDIPSGGDRVFRVHNEVLTKTLKVEREGSDWTFKSYNQQTVQDINELRSLMFLGFHNVEVITPANNANRITLDTGFRDKDFLVAVTKNATDAYWTVWTLKTKFPEFTPQLGSGGAFTPGANILYAALVTVHGELEIKAEDVSVDRSNLTNITGDTVQEAIDSIDDSFQPSAGVKGYAKVGSSDKIPFTDYGTSGTIAEIQAIPSNQLIAGHLYVGF